MVLMINLLKSSMGMADTVFFWAKKSPAPDSSGAGLLKSLREKKLSHELIPFWKHGHSSHAHAHASGTRN